ncbi:MAG: hypothetical protein ACREAA_15820 [Candidatus Polarisedimenticolia bacterium]
MTDGVPPGKKRSTWLYGCGIGCAVLGLVAAGLVAAGVVFFGRMTGGLNEAVEARKKLEQEHGAAETFTPWPDGTIPPERIEVFLQARERMAPGREALAAIFRKLPLSRSQAEEIKQAKGFHKFLKVLSTGKDAMNLVPEMGRYMTLRDRTLLELGMGRGEYTYLYATAYHAWLKHPAGDGPGDLGIREDGTDRQARFGGEQMVWRVHDELIAMLRNQQAALPAAAPKSWRSALEEEIAAMDKNPDRIAWQDGLPAPMEASLSPFRQRLEAGYSRDTNPFELTRPRKSGHFSWEAD